MNFRLVRFGLVGAILLVLAIIYPVLMNQFQLWRYRDAVESLDKFCLGVQRQERAIMMNTSVILDGKTSPLINHKEIYYTIGHKRLSIDFVQTFKQGVILIGEFEHMFSSSEQLRQKLFFRLEHDKTAWRVTAISEQVGQLYLHGR